MVEEMKAAERSRAATLALERKKVGKLFTRRILFIAVCAILLVLTIGASLTIGSAKISIAEAFAAVFAKLFPDRFEVRPLVETIVWHLRMPRVLVAALAGAILAMAGCTTMSVARNPLATPYTLGVSAGAGFGAALGFILGAGLVQGSFLIVGNAFVFSLIPAAVILFAARRAGITPETMILCGVATAYIFGACNTLLQFFAEADALRATVFWLVGDLARAAWRQLPYLLVALILFLVVNMRLAYDINIMRMGDDEAKGLGVDVEKTRRIVIVTACLATATVVSFTGAIGFIGLLAPHISRIVIGGDERYLIPASGLFGANLLLFADIIARTAAAPVMLPVGAITALLGGPMFIYLLLGKRGIARFRGS